LQAPYPLATLPSLHANENVTEKIDLQNVNSSEVEGNWGWATPPQLTRAQFFSHSLKKKIQAIMLGFLLMGLGSFVYISWPTLEDSSSQKLFAQRNQVLLGREWQRQVAPLGQPLLGGRYPFGC